jgi:glycosyltransferase involved in cell wall biosynthesis
MSLDANSAPRRQGVGSPAATTRSVDIMVPVFNEEANIDDFYTRVERLGYADSLVFVDNGSTDGTLDCLARYPNVKVIRHSTNEGYGASVRDGFASCERELFVIIDVDLEYPPETIPHLIDALETEPVVYCSRFLGPVPPAMPLFRRVGNRVVSALYNFLFGQATTDLYTGMKGLRRASLDLRALEKDGFEHGAEIASLIAMSGHRIAEIPVEYFPRNQGISKMRHIPESLKLVFYIVYYWMRCCVLGRPIGKSQTIPRG